MSTKTCIIYCRVSSTIDRNRQNTERQVFDLRKYAEIANLEVVNVFEEYISGGKANNQRVILQEAIQYCIDHKIAYFLSSELSRIGRSAFEVMETIKCLIDNHINLYLQKEQFTLLDDDGKPSLFAPVMLATLSTCAQIERDNISFRLKSGYDNARAKGVVVGRKKGSTMDINEILSKHSDIIALLKKDYSIRNIAKLTDKGISTIQRVKKYMRT